MLEIVGVLEVRLNVDGFGVVCCEHYLVDHYVCVTGVDPDVGECPVILVFLFDIVFEINGIDVL